jgi:hypothetical protein
VYEEFNDNPSAVSKPKRINIRISSRGHNVHEEFNDSLSAGSRAKRMSKRTSFFHALVSSWYAQAVFVDWNVCFKNAALCCLYYLKNGNALSQR